MQVVQRQERRFPGHPLLQLSLQVFHQQQPLIGVTVDAHLSGHGKRIARFPERRGERGEGNQLGQFVRRALSDSQPRLRRRGGRDAEQATLPDT